MTTNDNSNFENEDFDEDDLEYELTDDSDAEVNENFYEASSEEETNDKKSQKKKKVGLNDSQFYDPGADKEDQLWVNRQLDPIAAKKYKKEKQQQSEDVASNDKNKQKKKSEVQAQRTDAILSCPACFTTVCLQCQRHTMYFNQYRAMFVRNVKIDKEQIRRYSGDNSIYFPVFCDDCNTELAVLDPKDNIYHFFNVIPGS